MDSATAKARFADWFRRTLAAHGVEHTTFQAHTGLIAQTVYEWRTGEARPSPPKCEIIARYFRVPLLEVLQAAGHISDDWEDTGNGDEVVGAIRNLLKDIPHEDQLRWVLPYVEPAVRVYRRYGPGSSPEQDAALQRAYPTPDPQALDQVAEDHDPYRAR